MTTLNPALLSTLEQCAAAVAGSAEPQDAMASVLNAMAGLSGATLAQLAIPQHRARGFLSSYDEEPTRIILGPTAQIVWDEALLERARVSEDDTPRLRTAEGLVWFPIRSGAILLHRTSLESLDDEFIHRTLCVLAYQADTIERYTCELHESQCRIEAQERLHTQLLERNMFLRERAMIDELTGLYNRRFFERSLAHELERFHRYGHSLGVILINIDHFRELNDTYGHECGDLVLRHVAKVLRETVRTADLVARYDSVQMVLLMPDTDLAGSQILAERLRARIESTPFDIEGKRLVVTVSVGATAVEGHFNGSLEQVLQVTDAALHLAKSEGRNRVHVASL